MPMGDTANAIRADVEAQCTSEGRECRICLSEAPPLRELGCSCKGSLQMVHDVCADRWFTQNSRSSCEICHAAVVAPPVACRIHDLHPPRKVSCSVLVGCIIAGIILLIAVVLSFIAIIRS